MVANDFKETVMDSMAGLRNDLNDLIEWVFSPCPIRIFRTWWLGFIFVVWLFELDRERSLTVLSESWIGFVRIRTGFAWPIGRVTPAATERCANRVSSDATPSRCAACKRLCSRWEDAASWRWWRRPKWTNSGNAKHPPTVRSLSPSIGPRPTPPTVTPLMIWLVPAHKLIRFMTSIQATFTFPCNGKTFKENRNPQKSVKIQQARAIRMFLSSESSYSISKIVLFTAHRMHCHFHSIFFEASRSKTRTGSVTKI